MHLEQTHLQTRFEELAEVLAHPLRRHSALETVVVADVAVVVAPKMTCNTVACYKERVMSHKSSAKRPL